MPAHRVWAPAETATPVRDSDPPVGSAPKNPPARLAAPWATKSPLVFGRLPSGFGTAAEMPAAWASPTSATANPPANSSGMAAKLGSCNGGSAFGMDAMSPTVSTSTVMSDTTAVTRASATSVAKACRGLIKWNTAHTATVATATRHGADCQEPMCAKASMNLPMVL